MTRLKATVDDYAGRVADNPKVRITSDPTVSGYTRDPRYDPVIQVDIMDNALPKPNFVTVTKMQGGIIAGIGNVSAGACGAIMLKAVQDGGPTMAAALNSLRSSVVNYFDPNDDAKPGSAFTTLAINIQAVRPEIAGAAADAGSLCRTSLLASAPATPPAVATPAVIPPAPTAAGIAPVPKPAP
jgi:hypothetical protein